MSTESPSAGAGRAKPHLGGRVRRLCASALTLLVCTLSAPTPTHAASRADKKAAASLQAKAKRLHRTGKYAEAAKTLLMAHELAPHPGNLWRAATAYERAGDTDLACDTLEAFLALPEVQGATKGEAKAKREQATAKAAELCAAATGTLELTCTPAGATFELSGPKGKVQGQCPVTKEGLRAGAYTLQVEAKGFERSNLELKLPPKVTTRHEVRLTAETGTIVLRSSVANASVFVDGNAAGDTPTQELTLPIGPHDIEVRFSSQRTWRSEVVVAKGSRIELQAEPPPPPKPLPAPLPSPDPGPHWSTWAAAGLGGAALLAGGGLGWHSGRLLDDSSAAYARYERSRAAKDLEEARDLGDQYASSRDLAMVCAVTGGVVAVGAGALFLWTRGEAPEPGSEGSVAVVPFADATTRGVALVWRR